ncbi:hypothetical protein D6C86_09629 [Aureobasidium pullulans]|uniref:Rhodopsin domain-containing protein n=1 Tax=Aureobasidium pullulans TaxID=5580 RepID=A0A4S9UL24_AURPU|nr:hypothetical protein D6C94_10062 [Aureobasidium pullulans]THZ39334.1 hypothetical protein D6C87_07183 [Aureobasidium pullulans]THZ53962.1 hypothetical protein D6C86_09629 [Aureobasidium pullulans]THZ90100.1 hypothetical protein D6C88_04296 [Aureobasidium pullulans]
MHVLEGFLSRDISHHSPEYLAEDVSSRILTVTGFFCFFSIVIVSLRLYARAVMVRRLGWEDLSILVTALFVLGCWICFIFEKKSGVLGRHIAVVSIPQYENFLLWTFPHQLFLMLGVCTFKCSVAFFLIRVGRSRWARRALYGLMIFMTICTLVYASTLFWSCIPLRANWHLDEQKDAKMISTKVWRGLALWNSVINMTTDGILALWPIPIVYRMKVSLVKKILLGAALSLGWLAVVCGGMKTYAMWVYFTAEDKYFEDNYFIWSFLELSVGTIAASFPLLQPFVHKIRRSTSSNDDSGKVVMLPLALGPIEPPRAVIRRPVITWTGMGFTSIDGEEEIKWDGPARSGSSTRVDMERSDSGTIFVGYEGSKAFVSRATV